MTLPENWEKVPDRENVWYNSKSNTYVGFGFKEINDKYHVVSDNQLLSMEESEEKARETLKQWMQDNPEPSAMF